MNPKDESPQGEPSLEEVGRLARLPPEKLVVVGTVSAPAPKPALTEHNKPYYDKLLDASGDSA